MLDDFSRYLVAWKLCTTMAASDVTNTLNLALQASGLDHMAVVHRPRLLSDNGPCYVSGELAQWLEQKRMRHTRGAPFHPITQGGATQGPRQAELGGWVAEGKIERWHQTLKNRILLENYDLPSDLEAEIATLVDHYNTRRTHESLDNLTPTDVYTDQGQAILSERQRIKRQTLLHRRLQHIQQAA